MKKNKYKKKIIKHKLVIPSRDDVVLALERFSEPVSHKEIFNQLKLIDKNKINALKIRLRAMVRDKQLSCDDSGKLQILRKDVFKKGYIQIHPDGYGFVLLEDESDLFLTHTQANNVLDGDYVLALHIKTDGKGRKIGVIKEIITKNDKVLGRIYEKNNSIQVIPETKRFLHNIIVPKSKLGNAKVNNVVEVKILEHPCKIKDNLYAEVVKVIGDYLDPGVEIDIAISNYDIPNEWPQELLDSLDKFKGFDPNKVDGIKDLRELHFVTIDGEDSKDFDDAVYCEPKDNGWILYVAVAHVSYFVGDGTYLDKEAINRGTSVYFPNRVVPMLPDLLSCDLCSLVPNEDRLTVVCKMHISINGSLEKYEFIEAVIRSKERLTYNIVDSLLQKDSVVHQYVNNLHSLYKIISIRQCERGMLHLNIPETKIIFDSNKKIQAIKPTERLISHKIIESFMLMANICAAKLSIKEKLSVLFRNHKMDNQEKLKKLEEFLIYKKILVKHVDLSNSKELSKIIDIICSRDDANSLQMKILQTLSQAFYSPECLGHFGLALVEYTHFTSPIRRYPDLLLHRQIVKLIRKEKRTIDLNELKRMGEVCSRAERRAEEATRDVVNWLKCEYMTDKVGKTYKGTIVSVIDFGVFVELDDVYIEGLLHISELSDDKYRYDAQYVTLYGERTSKRLQIGDKLTIKVKSVNLLSRKIDFSI